MKEQWERGQPALLPLSIARCPTRTDGSGTVRPSVRPALRRALPARPCSVRPSVRLSLPRSVIGPSPPRLVPSVPASSRRASLRSPAWHRVAASVLSLCRCFASAAVGLGRMMAVPSVCGSGVPICTYSLCMYYCTGTLSAPGRAGPGQVG